MDRKKTILIAVLINAGLLALLFIIALHQEEEIAPNRTIGAPELAQETTPLFNEGPEPLLPLAHSEVPPEPPKAEIVHQLPPLISKPAPVAPPPAPAPAAALATMEIVVKKGDTLEKIAKAHGTTAYDLLKLNQLSNSFLRVGQVLKLPVLADKKELPKQALEARTASPTGQPPEYYTVKVGDNPWTIAMKHQMKVDELLKLNQLTEDKARKLKPGDRLRIR